jgi:hypothetical protein
VRIEGIIDLDPIFVDYQAGGDAQVVPVIPVCDADAYLPDAGKSGVIVQAGVVACHIDLHVVIGQFVGRAGSGA